MRESFISAYMLNLFEYNRVSQRLFENLLGVMRNQARGAYSRGLRTRKIEGYLYIT